MEISFRFWQLTEDTATINAASELAPDSGAFGAGGFANKKAGQYLDEIVETNLTITTQEKLNLELYKQVAIAKGVNPDDVLGTGAARQFVPNFLKGNLLERPEKNSSRPFDEDSNFTSTSQGFVSWFFDLFGFGSGNDETTSPINNNPECGTTDFDLMEKFAAVFGFMIPESDGVSSCVDPSKVMPPSSLSLVGDISAILDP